MLEAATQQALGTARLIAASSADKYAAAQHRRTGGPVPAPGRR